MDNKLIGAGTTIYFPVFVEDALFALGDLHAVMGDGEVAVTGLEVAGRVVVRLEVVPGLKLGNPVLETPDGLVTIASAATLDDAVARSAADMLGLLGDRVDLPKHELVMLMSLVGQTEVCQVVDPLKTARFIMPWSVLARYGVKL
jgi:amidase